MDPSAKNAPAKWTNDLEAYQSRERRLEAMAAEDDRRARHDEPPVDAVRRVGPRMNPTITAAWYRCPKCTKFSLLPMLCIAEGDNGSFTCEACNRSWNLFVYVTEAKEDE